MFEKNDIVKLKNEVFKNPSEKGDVYYVFNIEEDGIIRIASLLSDRLVGFFPTDLFELAAPIEIAKYRINKRSG